jgi:hypothetical protein
LLLLGGGGCLAPGDTSVLRLARQHRAGAESAERDLRQRQLQIAQQETRDTLAAIAAAKVETVRCAARLRAVRVDLALELERLHAAEVDLAAARARALVVEQELQPLHALEQQLLEQERLQAAAAQRLAALQTEVESSALAATARKGDLEARWQALQAQLAAAQRFEAAMVTAQAAAVEFVQSVLPPADATERPK